jgi:hypothetical protein
MTINLTKQISHGEDVIMYTKFISLLISIGTLLFSASVSAEVFHPELPIETTNVSITHAKPGGFLLVRPCESCAMLSLQFNKKSKAIKHGRSVSLSSIPSHSKTGITVIYDPATKIVHRVTW